MFFTYVPNRIARPPMNGTTQTATRESCGEVYIIMDVPCLITIYVFSKILASFQINIFLIVLPLQLL